MQISFDGEAFSAMVTVANAIPRGYVVALLSAGRDVPLVSDIVPGTDVAFLGAGPNGVTYRDLNDDAEQIGDPKTRGWDRVARIHVY